MSKAQRRAGVSNRTEQERERKHLRWIRKWEVFETLGRQCIRGVVVVACAGFAFLAIKATAGQETIWSIATKIEASLALSLGTNVVLLALLAREKHLRMQERRDKDQQISNFERKFDPNRTSSMMTVEGKRTILQPKHLSDDRKRKA